MKLTIDRGHRLNRIRIQGEGQAIVSVLDKIYAIFAEVEEQQREEYHAEIIAQQVRLVTCERDPMVQGERFPAVSNGT